MKGFAVNSFMAASAVLCAGVASASFTGFVVTSSSTTCNGQALTVYTLAARFDGSADTVERAFNLSAVSPDHLIGFWHKDNSGANDNAGALSQSSGSWDPTVTGSATTNRPFDSYLTIGAIARLANTSTAEATWFTGGNADTRGWNRTDLPDNGSLAWFNSNLANLQGRVGNSAGLALTDVRLGQFVLSAGHSLRLLSLEIAYNDGSAGGATQVASGSFTLGAVPAPGALALVSLAGVLSRSRRR
jgi:hypothetical protein